jgi:hypothetical protein
LRKAAIQRKRPFTDGQFQEEDLVFYQNRNKKAWRGPVHVFNQRGDNVFVWANGDIKKVAKCKVKMFKINDPSKNVGTSEEKEMPDLVLKKNWRMMMMQMRTKTESMILMILMILMMILTRVLGQGLRVEMRRKRILLELIG